MNNGVSVQGSVKHTGNYGASLTWGYNASRTVPSASEYYIAFRFRLPATGGAHSIVGLYEGSTLQLFLNATQITTGVWKIDACRGLSTILVSGSGSFVINTWYLIEVYAKVHDTLGVLTVKVDGVQDSTYSGDTQYGGTGVIDKIFMGKGNTFCTGYFDNWVVDDANWIGDSRIYGVSPDGAGATNLWTPSAGNNYECVDEVPPSDSDYIYTNTNDQIDTYSLANLGVSPYAIKSVQVLARAKKQGPATPQNIAGVVRTGGTDYAGSDQAITTAFAGYVALWEQNPYTTADWTESDVNGLEAGIKSRA